ncbi:MAG: hypothetical protein ACQETH_05520 [Candidatus Rifleibacteriota bacterium]
MTCEKFLNWLSQKDSFCSMDELPEAISLHLNSCRRCQKALEAHNSVFKMLPDAVRLSKETKQRIFAKLKTQIGQKTDDTKPFFATLISFMPQLGIAFVFIIALLIAFSAIKPDENRGTNFISGQCSVYREGKRIHFLPDNLPLFSGDRIKTSGLTTVAWGAKDQINITGSAQFIVGHNQLTMSSGKARMEFTSSAEGYEIVLRESIIKIVGTIIIIEITQNNESITVERGKIQWRGLETNKRGYLSSGETIRFSSGTNMNDKAEKNRSEQPDIQEPETTSDPILPD